MFVKRHPQTMRLYHGSDQVVEKPLILEPGRRMDFGKGFYVTGSSKQAENWAKTVKQRRESKSAFVSEYEFNESGELNILVFDGPTDDWLDFVQANRLRDVEHDYDVVIGPVADEGVYYVLMLYDSGAISKAETIRRMKIAKLDGQVLFHTDKSLESLAYIGYWEVI